MGTSIRTAALAAAMLLFPSCVPGPPRGAPLFWPPGGLCARDNAVPYLGDDKSIGMELTRLFANCAALPTCAAGWSQQETRNFPDSNPASIVWQGPASHVFTVGEQNSIGIRARDYARANGPAGKQLYRLTFASNVFTAGSPAHVSTTAYYGLC